MQDTLTGLYEATQNALTPYKDKMKIADDLYQQSLNDISKVIDLSNHTMSEEQINLLYKAVLMANKSGALQIRAIYDIPEIDSI